MVQKGKVLNRVDELLNIGSLGNTLFPESPYSNIDRDIVVIQILFD